VDGDVGIGDGVRVVATPGHTPGHQSVLLDNAGGTVLVTGDLLVHAVQLLDPLMPYTHDMDRDAARDSRAALLRDLAARGDAVLATAHLGEPFVALGSPG